MMTVYEKSVKHCMQLVIKSVDKQRNKTKLMDLVRQKKKSGQLKGVML